MGAFLFPVILFSSISTDFEVDGLADVSVIIRRWAFKEKLHGYLYFKT